MSEALDRHITGNYGEDQWSGLSHACMNDDCDDCESEDCECKHHIHPSNCGCDNCKEGRANVVEWIRDSRD